MAQGTGEELLDASLAKCGPLAKGGCWAEGQGEAGKRGLCGVLDWSSQKMWGDLQCVGCFAAIKGSWGWGEGSRPQRGGTAWAACQRLKGKGMRPGRRDVTGVHGGAWMKWGRRWNSSHLGWGGERGKNVSGPKRGCTRASGWRRHEGFWDGRLAPSQALLTVESEGGYGGQADSRRWWRCSTLTRCRGAPARSRSSRARACTAADSTQRQGSQRHRQRCSFSSKRSNSRCNASTGAGHSAAEAEVQLQQQALQQQMMQMPAHVGTMDIRLRHGKPLLTSHVARHPKCRE